MSCSDGSLLKVLIASLPKDKKYVFKIQQTTYITSLRHFFRLQKVRTFISYSATHDFIPRAYPEVTEQADIDERLLPLWRHNGYTEDEVTGLFARRARSYSIYHFGRPISTCFIFQNYVRIWEVGAVHTLSSHRGRGFAQKVVQTALSHILAMKLVPRYQVEEHNEASIRLAESIGLQKIVILEHVLNQ